jgi:excisionase family DNA binding protein
MEGPAAVRRSVTLHEAADLLGVHYMTAYRYVRTGRLRAVKDGVQWRVDVADVAKLGTLSPPTRRAVGPRRWAVDQLANRMIAGDEAGAWALVNAALAAGAAAGQVHLEMLAPALERIGTGWATGQLGIADEHRGAVVAHRVVGRLGPLFAHRGRRRGTVIIGAAPGERHALPGAMVADQLRGARFEVIDLGADAPAESFAVTASDAPRLVAVLVGATCPARGRALARVIAAVRATTSATILTGGAAVADDQTALSLGADGWSGLDAGQAVDAVERSLLRPPAGILPPLRSGSR